MATGGFLLLGDEPLGRISSFLAYRFITTLSKILPSANFPYNLVLLKSVFKISITLHWEHTKTFKTNCNVIIVIKMSSIVYPILCKYTN